MTTKNKIQSLLVLFSIQLACFRTGDSMSPRFAINPIEVPGNGVIYLKRQLRGLNFDELALSPDPARCTPANPETDYVFDGLGAGAFPVFYSTADRKLTIYDTVPLIPPKHPIKGVTVEVRKLNPSEYAEMVSSYRSKGIMSIRPSEATFDCR